jgi:starch synthase
LDDTIDSGTGFKFADYSGEAFLEAVGRAVAAWSDAEGWQKMMRAGMERDFSWQKSAAAYSDLYRQLLG